MQNYPCMKRFIECHLPSTACNMECEYCYITQQGERKKKKVDLSECVEKIKYAVSPERLGGICMFNICAAGETLIPKEIVPIVYDILSLGHYVMVVTNGTLTARFNEFCAFPEEYRKRLFFKCSLHYIELKKHDQLELYANNIRLIKDAGISFTVELTPDDSYIPYIPEIKKYCLDNFGALCHITVSRDDRYADTPFLSKLPIEEFKKTWEEFDSELFEFKYSIFGVKRKEFCYAGDWDICLNLQTGDYKQCYKGKKIGNIYANMDKPLKYMAVGHNCPEPHCYNGHAFLGFGMIPDLDSVIDYADQRNRKCSDGTQWLSEPMEQFMRGRLKDANQEYDSLKKLSCDICSINLKQKVKNLLRIN